MAEGEAQDTPPDQVDKIVEAAAKLGVEVDKAQATQWLADMAAAQAPAQDWAVDQASGTYGHRVALLDFGPEALDRYRRLAAIVEIPDRPGVETAISLSGSAAQARVQLFPGDADFFERVNIQAATREEACRLLGEVMRDKVLSAYRAESYEFVEAKWGTFQEPVQRAGQPLRRGSPISWSALEARQGYIDLLCADGEPLRVDWSYGCREPGWCKLDWVIVEADQGTVVHASNMLDATWEAPDGSIVALDGVLDPYFQEIYLDAGSIPVFSKLVRNLSPQALRDYTDALKREVVKYCSRDPRNFGKVAKRLYNIFRLEGQWAEAAYVRELFDEPAALLYQVSALLDTLDEAMEGGANWDRDAITAQVDQLIRSVVKTTEGASEEALIDALLRLRDNVSGRHGLGEGVKEVVQESNRLVMELVNSFFRDRLLLMPEVRTFIESLTGTLL
ncbi:MAG TPA: hypothetical protein PKO09_09795 [Anaerolineae bacterium]|nr:hypothetical protein [Anaerolineae bacterium]